MQGLSPIIMLLRAGLSLVILLPISVADATVIETFSDKQCQTSSDSLDGPNGYPDGECTQFGRQGDFGSFKVIREDTGCLGREQSEPHHSAWQKSLTGRSDNIRNRCRSKPSMLIKHQRNRAVREMLQFHLGLL